MSLGRKYQDNIKIEELEGRVEAIFNSREIKDFNFDMSELRELERQLTELRGEGINPYEIRLKEIGAYL